MDTYSYRDEKLNLLGKGSSCEGLTKLGEVWSSTKFGTFKMTDMQKIHGLHVHFVGFDKRTFPEELYWGSIVSGQTS